MEGGREGGEGEQNLIYQNMLFCNDMLFVSLISRRNRTFTIR